MKPIQGPLVTEAGLRQDFADLGVVSGSTLMVHSSLSALGWVIGGPQTVVRALLGMLGKTGTLIMPAATPQGADPATWTSPEVPEEFLEILREHLPIFDPQTTPTALGAIPEAFRTWPGTLRSHHPLESICARGLEARKITSEHPLAFSEGRDGPFGKLYDLDSWILLLGVGFNRCTALHFAESLVEKRRTMRVRFPVFEEGQRRWIEVPNVADDNDTLFPLIGKKFLSTAGVKRGHVAQAEAILFPMRSLVDFATHCFEDLL